MRRTIQNQSNDGSIEARKKPAHVITVTSNEKAAPPYALETLCGALILAEIQKNIKNRIAEEIANTAERRC